MGERDTLSSHQANIACEKAFATRDRKWPRAGSPILSMTRSPRTLVHSRSYSLPVLAGFGISSAWTMLIGCSEIIVSTGRRRQLRCEVEALPSSRPVTVSPCDRADCLANGFCCLV